MSMSASGMRRVLVASLLVVLTTALWARPAGLQTPPPPTAPAPYVATFDGAPGAPQPFAPPDWDITVFEADVGATLGAPDAMTAGHGADCAPPPATHAIHSYPESVFLCLDHVMTSIFGAVYGEIVMTPNRQVDFSQGEVVIRWDVSTKRTSSRDWWSVNVIPFGDNLQTLGNGESFPRNVVRVELSGGAPGKSILKTSAWRNGAELPVASSGSLMVEDVVGGSSATRRDRFELRLSRTHLKTWMPEYGRVWTDQAIPDLGWSRGVVEIIHHSYDPQKCDPGEPLYPCTPNTWHWDNLSLSSAVPFTILRASQRLVSAGGVTRVTLPQPAPAGSFLRFVSDSVASPLEFSTNGGASWTRATLQTDIGGAPPNSRSFWTAFPAGGQTIDFRGGGGWRAQDLSVWAEQAGDVPTPTPTPVVTVTPPPTVMATATAVPPSASPTTVAVATATPTVAPGTCDVLVRKNGTLAWLPKPVAFCEESR